MDVHGPNTQYGVNGNKRINIHLMTSDQLDEVGQTNAQRRELTYIACSEREPRQLGYAPLALITSCHSGSHYMKAGAMRISHLS